MCSKEINSRFCNIVERSNVNVFPLIRQDFGSYMNWLIGLHIGLT